MCTETEQQDMQREMAAYDALPGCIQKVFDEAPRKTSVYNTMNLVGMRRYRTDHGDEAFATVLRDHLALQAEQEAEVSV